MPDPGTNRWTHPEVILVATDLSDLDRLMAFAVEQAANTGARWAPEEEERLRHLACGNTAPFELRRRWEELCRP